MRRRRLAPNAPVRAASRWTSLQTPFRSPARSLTAPSGHVFHPIQGSKPSPQHYPERSRDSGCSAIRPATNRQAAAADRTRHLATDDAVPISHGLCLEREWSPEARLEVVLHEPLFDQMRLGEGTPDLLGRMRHQALDNDGARGGELFVHWSILLSRSSRPSNRLCQKPFIWPVQSISGAKAPTSAL